MRDSLLSSISRLYSVIRTAGIISRVNLIIKSGITISQYEKLKPFLEEYYLNQIRYDREHKLWEYLESPSKENE